MAKAEGITVQCITCKAKKVLSFAEAGRGMPFCEKDGSVMVAVSATIKRK